MARMPTTTPTILVVDDTPGCRLPMARMLRANGFQTRTACDGREAFDGLSADGAVPPDLILLDLAMPVMDGPAFLTAVRGDPRWASVPVVVVSGEGPGALEAARRLGAVGAVAKGEFRVGELLDLIRRHIKVCQ